MSRAEFFFGSDKKPETPLHEWVRQNTTKETLLIQFKAPGTFSGKTEVHMVEGEILMIRERPTISGNENGSSYHYYLTVGDKHEAKLMGLGLIPSNEGISSDVNGEMKA